MAIGLCVFLLLLKTILVDFILKKSSDYFSLRLLHNSYIYAYKNIWKFHIFKKTAEAWKLAGNFLEEI